MPRHLARPGGTCNSGHPVRNRLQRSLCGPLARNILAAGRTALLSVPLVCAAVTSAIANEHIRIGTNVWPGYEPFHLIDEHAPADLSRRLEPIRFWNASEVTSALQIGLLDMAGLTLDEAVSTAAQGHDLVVLAVTDISSGADIICTTDPAIPVHDRIYAYESTALGEYFLYLYLAENGLHLSDVKQLNASVDEHLGLLGKGQADTFLTFEPFASDLRAEGCATIFDSARIAPAILDVLVVRKDRYDRRMARDITAILASYERITDRIRSRDPAIAAPLALGLGVTPPDLFAQYDGLTLPTLAQGDALLQPDAFNDLVAGVHSWLVASGRTDLSLADLRARITTFHETKP